MATPKLKLGNDKWATKQRSLLAFNDEGNNFKSLPFQVERLSRGSYVGRNGLVQYAATEEPRIDFTNYSKGALLLEPQRTNSVVQSNDLSTTWVASSGVTLTANQSSPDGGTNAYKVEMSASGNRFLYITGGTSGVQYTISGYFRADANTTIGFSDGNLNPNSINLTTEWQRFTFTYTSGSSVLIQIDNYFGVSPAQEAKTFYAFGLQAEAGSYATSLIPTAGSASTRIKDEVINGGNDYLFNDTEGTLFVDLENFDVAGGTEVTLSNGFSSNRVVFLFYGTDSIHYRKIRFFVSSGTTQVDSTYTISYTFNQRNKIAFRYKQNDFKAYINGTQVFSDTLGNTPVGLSRLDFTNFNGTTGFMEAEINQAMVFNEALTDAELATLTTI